MTSFRNMLPIHLAKKFESLTAEAWCGATHELDSGSSHARFALQPEGANCPQCLLARTAAISAKQASP